MIKYYLIPAHFVPLEPDMRLVREPKYIISLGINWVGTYIESKDIYMVKANCKDQEKIDALESNVDVVALDGKRETKDKVSKQLKIGKISDSSDEINEIGKLQDANFTKESLQIAD